MLEYEYWAILQLLFVHVSVLRFQWYWHFQNHINIQKLGITFSQYCFVKFVREINMAFNDFFSNQSSTAITIFFSI